MNREERIQQVLVQEVLEQDIHYWWLSFADSDLPEGSQFLGVCIIKAASIASAVTAAHMLKINPGGEVAGYELDNTEEVLDKVGPHVNKLLSRDELRELGLVS